MRENFDCTIQAIISERGRMEQLHISAYDITSGVHTNAHEDAFLAPRTNVRLVAVFGAFKVPRVHSCALHLHYPLGL